MRAHPTLVVVVLSLASLAGWTPLRVAEQSLSPLLAPANAMVLSSLPFDERLRDREHVEELRSEAHDAWLAWRAAVLDRPAPTSAGVELMLAPVVGGDQRRRELIIKVPVGACVASTPVTWRGVLVGFLRPWSRDGDRVDRDGLARVALLGHPMARPVAATWQAGPQAAAVHFLLTTGDDGPTIAHRSRPFDPMPGQLAWSRDVSDLGDDLPGGLLLGRLVGRASEQDRPGGGLLPEDAVRPTDIVPSEDRVEPLADPFELGHVAIEIRVPAQISVPGQVHVPAQPRGPASMEARRTTAHFVASSSADSVRIDGGLVDGVHPGDVVIQDAVLVGVVETAGPTSSVVRVGDTTGLLLLVSEDGSIVGATCAASGWPAGWRPRMGQSVLAGHRTLGGFRVGTVSRVDGERFDVQPAAFDPRGPVTVVEP